MTTRTGAPLFPTARGLLTYQRKCGPIQRGSSGIIRRGIHTDTRTYQKVFLWRRLQAKRTIGIEELVVIVLLGEEVSSSPSLDCRLRGNKRRHQCDVGVESIGDV